MYEAHSAEYIQIHESIVIKFFLRPKLHKIDTYVTRFNVENFNFIVSQGKGAKFDRFVDANVRGTQRRIYSDLRIYRS